MSSTLAAESTTSVDTSSSVRCGATAWTVDVVRGYESAVIASP